VDVINYADFFVDQFRGIDFVWVEICLFLLELNVAVTLSELPFRLS